MNVIEFLQQEDLFLKITDKLSRLSELPTEGFIAGGSVAAIVYQMYTGKEASFTDIDVFRLATEQLDCDSNADYFSNPDCKIKNVSKIDLINTIDVQFEREAKHISAILETFDINCCRIGIDLAEEKVYYTQEYVDFLIDKQIDICNLQHPTKILFRLIKKKKQYPDCFCNLDRIARFLFTIAGRTITLSWGVPDYISREDLEFFKQYEQVDVTDSQIRIYGDCYLDELKDVCCGTNTNEIYAFYKNLYGKGVNSYKKNLWLKICSREIIANYALCTPNYLEPLPKDWEARLNKFNNFLKEHALHRLFDKLTLEQQLTRFSQLNKLIREEGLWIIGVLEHNFEYDIISYDVDFEQWVTKLIELKKKQLSVVRVEPLPVDSYYLGCTVVELVTGLDCMNEGAYNKHCVGGYSESLSATHRIFSIRYEKLRFTTEVSYSERQKKWILNQCKAFQNKNPSHYGDLIERRIDAVVSWLLFRLDELHTSKKRNVLFEIGRNTNG